MRRVVVFTLLCPLLGAVLYAQPPAGKPTSKPVAPVTLPAKPVPAPPPKPLEPSGPDDNRYYPYGQRMEYKSGKENLWVLQGDAQLAHKDTKFLADKVLYNETTKIASSPGKLRIEDPQNTLIGDTGVAYYKKELRYADVVGNVKIDARPKNDDPKAMPTNTRREFKTPVTITCDKVRYWWKERHGFTNTNVKITFTKDKKDWVVTADSLDYYGKDERVVLVGNVIAKSNKGDALYADKGEVIVKEGSEQLNLSPLKMPSVIQGDKEDEEDNGKDKKSDPPKKDGT